MKKIIEIIVLVMIVIFTLSISLTTAAAPVKNKVKIDGKDTKIETVVIKNQNYIPIKQLDSYLKTTTSYNNKTKTIIIKQNKKTIKFQIGKYGSKIINGRTLIPIRALSDIFKYKVFWNNDKKTVFVITANIIDVGYDNGIEYINSDINLKK